MHPIYFTNEEYLLNPKICALSFALRLHLFFDPGFECKKTCSVGSLFLLPKKERCAINCIFLMYTWTHNFKDFYVILNQSQTPYLQHTEKFNKMQTPNVLDF